VLAGSISLQYEPLHLGDGVRNREPKRVQQRSDWLKADGRFDIAEHYVHRHFGLIVWFKSPFSKGTDNGLPGTVKKLISVRDPDGFPILSRPVRTYNYAITEGCKAKDGRKQRMFVHDIEPMKVGEDLTGTTWESLYPDEKVLSVLSGGLYSLAMGRIADPRAFRMDRKGRTASLFATINFHEFPKGVIEGRPHVVDSIANNQAACWFRALVNCDGDKAALKVEIYPRRIRVTVKGRVEIDDMLLSPFNL
jgi:hypothetical protein